MKKRVYAVDLSLKYMNMKTIAVIQKFLAFFKRLSGIPQTFFSNVDISMNANLKGHL
jgi:hypothetical protein